MLQLCAGWGSTISGWTRFTPHGQVKCFEEAGRVCERLTPKDMDGNPNVNNRWLHKARWYSLQGCSQDTLQWPYSKQTGQGEVSLVII